MYIGLIFAAGMIDQTNKVLKKKKKRKKPKFPSL